jgi:hypothetical protein
MDLRGHFADNRRARSLAARRFVEDVTASLSPVQLGPWSTRPDVGHTGVTGSYLDIRIEERHQVRSAVKPGVVVQVCGPPMVGKATIVRQVSQTFLNRGDKNCSVSSAGLSSIH